MAASLISVPFQLSYEEFEDYPHNLIYRPSCTAISKAYKARLDELDVASLKLFIEDDEVADVPFRDFIGPGKLSRCPPKTYVLTSRVAFERRNIFNDSKLKDWIGDKSSTDPLETTDPAELATKPDPKCRFM